MPIFTGVKRYVVIAGTEPGGEEENGQSVWGPFTYNEASRLVGLVEHIWRVTPKEYFRYGEPFVYIDTLRPPVAHAFLPLEQRIAENWYYEPDEEEQA